MTTNWHSGTKTKFPTEDLKGASPGPKWWQTEYREKSHSSQGAAVVRIWAEFAAPILTKMNKEIFYSFFWDSLWEFKGKWEIASTHLLQWHGTLHSLRIFRDLHLGELCSIIDSSWIFFSWLIFSLTTYMHSYFLFLPHHSPLPLSFFYGFHHASLPLDSSFSLCFKFAVSLNYRFSR